MRLHVAHAAAGEVRAQAELFVCGAAVVACNPIGVHALAGGVVRREIQLVERVKLARDVILLEDLKAHGAERVVQIVAHLGDGMQRAARRQDAGHGAVEVRGNLGSLQLQFLSLIHI